MHIILNKWYCLNNKWNKINSVLKYIIVQKFVVCKIFCFWKKSLMFNQGWIYLIKNAVSCEILLQFKITIFYLNIYI